MKYIFRCSEHNYFEIEASIHDGPPQRVECPTCNALALRVFQMPPTQYHTQGFHNTDYDKTGDKLEKFNKNWSEKYNEPPPPPAKDVPRNSSDPY